MSDTPDYSTCRTTPHAARRLLQELGYTAVRVVTPTLPIDIIAWKNRQEILLIKVKSLRRPLKKDCLVTEMNPLFQMAASGTCPGSIQLWIRRAAIWDRYHVMAGGFAAIKEGVHGI